MIPEPGKIGIRLEGSLVKDPGAGLMLPHIAAITPGSQADLHGTPKGLRAGLVLVAVQGAALRNEAMGEGDVANGRDVAMRAIGAAGRPLTLRFKSK